jgi:T5SS/PEP-CTERM-associated repeat protein
MKTNWWHAAQGILLVAFSGSAQLVNDGATATLNHITNTISGSVIVGTNGAFTLLILTNGAFLTNSGTGTIGLNAGANSNTVNVTSANTRWAMSSDLYVGSIGSFNHLVITNGGLVQNGYGALGLNSSSASNLVVVTTPGSVWTNQNDLYVGYVGQGNSLVISNGGLVVNSAGILGSDQLSINNLAVITGSGSLWSNRASLTVGFISRGNTLVVSNSARVFASNNVIVGLDSGSISNSLVLSSGAFLTNRNNGALGVNPGGNGNRAFVSGSNTLWGLGQSLFVGSNGAMNRLVVSNGAQVFNSLAGNIGSSTDSSNNSAVVTGAGSAWQMRADFELGYSGAGNLLVITNGGLLANSDGGIGGFISASNNQAFVTGTNSVWTNHQDFILGIAGTGNELLVGDGGLLENVQGTIGNAISSSNNQATVTGAGAVWNNRAELNVGYGSSGNQLTVAKSGVVFASNSVFLGFMATSSNNWLHVYGGILRSTNAIGTASLDIRRGTNLFDFGTIETDKLVMTNSVGSFQFNGGFLITRSAVISNAAPFVLGIAGAIPAIWDLGAGISNHFLSGSLIVGSNSSLNQLLITNGATLTNVNGSGFVGMNAGANSNLVLLSGSGSQWLKSDSLLVGNMGSFNRLVVSNGAFMANTGNGTVANGSTSSNNQVVVTGAGSLWTNGDDLFVGFNGSGNLLIVTNEGTVYALKHVYLGFHTNSLNNRIVVDGGTLRTTNDFGSGNLIVNGGTNVLNSGEIEVGLLDLTSSQGVFEFNGGTLLTQSTTNNNGRSFAVGNGVNTAILSLAGYGSHSFANGLTIRSNASLVGNGVITGTVVVQHGGTLAPGNSLGLLSLNNPPVLQGSTVMEIINNGLMQPNDQLAVVGALTYGGALIVTNISSNPLTAGVEFFLFSANSYGGSFASIILPPLPAGLSWTNKLLSSGSIQVVGPSLKFNSITRSGTNLVFSGGGGSSGATYWLLSTTNLAISTSNWTRLLTNQLDSGGNFIFTNGISPTIPSRFYQLQVP